MVVHVVKISAHSKLYLACISNLYYALLEKLWYHMDTI